MLSIRTRLSALLGDVTQEMCDYYALVSGSLEKRVTGR